MNYDLAHMTGQEQAKRFGTNALNDTPMRTMKFNDLSRHEMSMEYTTLRAGFLRSAYRISNKRQVDLLFPMFKIKVFREATLRRPSLRIHI